jgi:serine/threonine protein kinase
MRIYRKQIISTLKRVHALGIVHGDFAERNMVRGLRPCIIQLLRPRYVLIDFSYARMDHHCKGAGCHELQDAIKVLGLTTELSVQSRAFPWIRCFAIPNKLTICAVLTVAWIYSGTVWWWRDDLVLRIGRSIHWLTYGVGWWQ